MKEKGQDRAEAPQRLTPKPDVLRKLYLLSGNNCAMTACDAVIIDRKGVMIGCICHIEAAMPDGPRFNANQTNNDRRALSNLVLMCANHHNLIDSKKHEGQWPVAAIRKLKADHEARFEEFEDLMQKSFQGVFVDSTALIDPTRPQTYNRLEELLPDSKLEEADVSHRARQIDSFIESARRMPLTERNFMLSVIKRSIYLGLKSGESILVHTDDIGSAFNIRNEDIDRLGNALERYGIGDVGLHFSGESDDYFVFVKHPSDYLTWFDINEFCEKTENQLEDFVIHLKFGALD